MASRHRLPFAAYWLAVVAIASCTDSMLPNREAVPVTGVAGVNVGEVDAARPHARSCHSCDTLPAAYLVQAVQSRTRPVPLVAFEEALLRVFITADTANSVDIPGIAALFYAGDSLIHVEHVDGKAGPIPTEVDEGDLAKSVNVSVRSSVVRPGLELVVYVLDTLPKYLGVPARIPESGRLKVDVRRTPTFDLTAIPFLWTVDPDSSIIAVVDSMADHPEHSHVLHPTRTLLPIGDMDVVAHRPVWSTSDHPVMLLLKTRAIRLMEGGDGYYMGTMTRTRSPIKGMAFIGGRSSFSVPDGLVMAHGFGHNLSLLHAPCGVYNGDPRYPHEGGVTGAWGWNGWSLVKPTTPDLMGYCNPKWISDYHFTKAMNYRTAQAMAPKASRAPARSLLLWGGAREDGTPFLNPAFVLDAPPTLPRKEGGYRLVGTDAEGRELFSLAFAMSVAAEGHGHGTGFTFTLPVQAGWEDHLRSITLAGPGGEVALDGHGEQPMAILRDRTTGRVHAILGDLPSTTRTYTAAAELLSPGPELTLQFSRGIPGVEAWR